MRAKYLFNTKLEFIEPKAHYSPFWRSLLMIKDDLFNKICIQIGTGEATSFQYDKWLPSGPLGTQIVSDPPAWCASFRVSQFCLMVNGGWTY